MGGGELMNLFYINSSYNLTSTNSNRTGFQIVIFWLVQLQSNCIPIYLQTNEIKQANENETISELELLELRKNWN